MRKITVFILCVFFFVLGLLLNPFNLYEEKKNKEMINEILADPSVTMNLLDTSLENNYDVINIKNNIFKIIMDDETTFILFFEKGQSYLEVFEYKNSMRWYH